MRTAKDFRDIEKAFHEVANAAGRCADLEESESATDKEKEEALKEFVWSVGKMQMVM